jgi:Protein of unknown function (DUF938)
MPPTLRKCCPLSCGSLQTLIRALASIAAHRTATDAPNLLSPLWLDAMSEQWPIQHADALVCINMIHITPWAASNGLMTGAERTLRSGGVLYLYGPYQINGRHTAQSNQEFDAWLRTQNAEWGVRDIAEVTKLAQRHRFSLAETVSMPANNLSVIFARLSKPAELCSMSSSTGSERCRRWAT